MSDLTETMTAAAVETVREIAIDIEHLSDSQRVDLSELIGNLLGLTQHAHRGDNRFEPRRVDYWRQRTAKQLKFVDDRQP